MRFGLAGSPIAHSLSPAMHNAALAALGIDGRYDLRVTELADVPALVDELRRGVWDGCNITTPLKTAVAPYCVCDETAARAGAVNTVWRDSHDVLRGALTDVHGVRAPLAERDVSFSQTLGEALVLGAGGAARAAALALESLGARVSVAARDEAKAAEVLTLLYPDHRGEALPLGDLTHSSALAHARVIAQATSVGRSGKSLPLRWADVSAIAFEMLYTPRQTPFLTAAQDAGCQVIEGWEMLLAQGAESLRLWLGRNDVPVDMMRATLLKALR